MSEVLLQVMRWGVPSDAKYCNIYTCTNPIRNPAPYRRNSRIQNSAPLGSYSRPVPEALWWH